ncbi:type I-E CRISPR-associated endoribonuclease Cas2 [Fibrella sp. HMF5335]|uniref:Type I-E CRISPR-associated endoribonuclease Cas2 n=1 Tax=Fibrella rubiginis TaxID=2817060 RepID=A0A939GLQ2_9BACT|nr:type I-E CRISPR-associated endoribonuclease Cas2e [Fibrella rubiginis]MBO0938688.1 type I-E CRISPR-associated endoribonuclease Cas2 [Fibrella rubiginis]
MTILIVECVSPSLRGDLSRWLVELQAGVFVGRVSEVVREALWERATNRADDGTVLLLWRTNNEQGFDMRSWQPKQYVPINVEGLWLTRHPASTHTG